MLQPNTWMQMPFRFKFGTHKWYLGQTGELGTRVCLILVLHLIWYDCLSGPCKTKQK